MRREVKHSFAVGDWRVTLETGVMAGQATGAALIRVGETVLLATVVAESEASEPRDFFPLTVNYQERYYANGRIPGGYVKREGRPSVGETLIARLIDRPIRPLFAEDFTNEVQVVVTLLSLDPEIAPDIPALIATSAALMTAGLPFKGPVAGVRVGYKDGKYLLNPKTSEMADSQLDLVVAGTADAVVMVESKAKILPEETMLQAILFGHEQMQAIISGIQEFARLVDAPAMAWQSVSEGKVQGLIDIIRKTKQEAIEAAFAIRDKQEREQRLTQIQRELVAETELAESDVIFLQSALFIVERELVRKKVLETHTRIDGRDFYTVRPISIQTGVLPRAHGSAIFTRGETQALVVTTLGSGSDVQTIDAVAGEQEERFFLHYNFPPYCTGSLGVLGSPKRRELGHGNLARRALEAVIPPEAEFPYVVRVVSEITSSNGSSSMASVCGGCLSLMDAGVPIKAPVAGIAMGLVKEGDNYVVLTDIMGDEDHLGDMDFKVAGTETGVTALQMDIKISGITAEIMRQALQQAKQARLHILGLMQQALPAPRAELSIYAPRLITFKIDPSKIKDVIGKGGSTIKSIVETSGATVDLKDNGLVTIASPNGLSAQNARHQIEMLLTEPEVGMVYEGVVTKILDFGAVMTILPGKEGLLHISQISDQRVENVTDVLKEGQRLKVKIISIDNSGKIRLSRKALLEEQPAP